MAIQTISTAYNPVSGVFGTGQVQMYFTSGSWAVPTGISKVRARVWGGGGYNQGGGGGFSLRTVYDLTGVTSIAVTVGAGGNSTTTTGGTSSFGSYCSATGGVVTGTGGSGSGGDINYSGGNSGGAASIFGPGNSNVGGTFGGAGYGGSIDQMASSGFLGTGGMTSTASAGAIAAPPASGLRQFSIDYIGTGGGAASGQNGINGGGGGNLGTSQGGIPGGGGGNTTGPGGRGLVIVEW